MPTPYHALHDRHRFKLKEAAEKGYLAVVRCMLCHSRPVVFAATDLIKLLHPDRDFYRAPFPCSRCQREDYVKVELRVPSDSDVGRLVVRRLAGISRSPRWRNEYLGDGDLELGNRARDGHQ